MSKPKIMILGTFHMEHSGDLFQTEMDNVLSDKRQKEIRQVIEKVKHYKPTKVAVEVEKKENNQKNKDYQDFLVGNYQLGMNEVDQIGYRIAAELNHPEVYCIDWMERGVATRAAGEVYQWAKINEPDLFQLIYGELEGMFKRNSRYQSILEMYQEINKPEMIKMHQKMYINSARLKSMEEYIGLDWLLWWYQRNLIIFTNVTELIETDDERILGEPM